MDSKTTIPSEHLKLFFPTLITVFVFVVEAVCLYYLAQNTWIFLLIHLCIALFLLGIIAYQWHAKKNNNLMSLLTSIYTVTSLFGLILIFIVLVLYKLFTFRSVPTSPDWLSEAGETELPDEEEMYDYGELSDMEDVMESNSVMEMSNADKIE